MGATHYGFKNEASSNTTQPHTCVGICMSGWVIVPEPLHVFVFVCERSLTTKTEGDGTERLFI